MHAQEYTLWENLIFYPFLLQVEPIKHTFAFGQCEARFITVSLKDTHLENQCNLIVSGKRFLRTSDIFGRPLLPMFWTSGNICFGFQIQGRSPHLYASLSVYKDSQVHLWCKTYWPFGNHHGSLKSPKWLTYFFKQWWELFLIFWTVFNGSLIWKLIIFNINSYLDEVPTVLI